MTESEPKTQATDETAAKPNAAGLTPHAGGQGDVAAPQAGASEAAENGKGHGGANGATAENGRGAANGESDAAEGATSEGAAKMDAPAEKPAQKEEAPLLAPGNPLRKWRGGITAGVSGFLALLLMAHNGQLAIGVPLGTLLMIAATWGVMDLLGTFDDPLERIAASTTLDALKMPLAGTAVAFGAFCVSLWGGQSGLASQALWGALVTATFLAFVAALFKVGQVLGPWAKDEKGLSRPLFKRHGFWVVAIGALLYFPMMGTFSLWDPWETHYGEVAREVLARDDWISLWWAQDGWFWSKPILNFWIQALAMATLGTHYKSDQMLQGVAGHMAHPEWVVRAPNVLLTILAMYVIYKGVAKIFGRRAGMLGGFVLATMPDWFFLAHQTMTDMPFVAAMTTSMGLLLLGLNTEGVQMARVYEVKVGKTRWGLTAWHLVFGVIILCALPQILYLVSRNVELVLHGSGPKGFRLHYDEFRSGSAGNCGLPGNEQCILTNPASIPKSLVPHPDGLGPNLLRFFGAFEPVLQGLVWSLVLGALLYLNWGERRVRRLYYLAAWFFAAIATMGKGPAGFAIPMICAFAYIATKKRWSELLKVEMLSGLLIILAVGIPWWVAMYVRHGSPFTDRIIFHDMFNRAFNHVHDTNEGDDVSFRFYIWQLGYALFPWTSLAPLGLIWWARRGDSADKGRADASVLLAMWFIFAFFLFSFMGTKFHHYIFPAVPPVAMLIGIVLDDMLGDRPLAQPGKLWLYLVGLGGGAAIAIVGASRFFPGSLFGGRGGAGGAGELMPASPVVGAALFLVGAAIVAGTILFLRPSARAPEPASDPDDERRALHERLMIAGASVAGALVLVLVGRDLAIKPEGADQPGAIRLLQLFTYNYRRPWPDTLDFGAILAGFAVVGVVVLLAIAFTKLRHHMTALFVAVACVWAVWGVDVYMIKTAPHWGQHEVIAAYYENRASPEEPLVAYQMNWKGENFYTSNHVPAFVSSGATFASWMKQQREKGVKVMYFVTEHSRTGGLKSEVGAKTYREVTDRALNNKFVLVRAEL